MEFGASEGGSVKYISAIPDEFVVLVLGITMLFPSVPFGGLCIS